MKWKLVLILALFVLVPVGLLGWLGARVARGEQAEVERRFDELLRRQLLDIDEHLARLMGERERQMQALLGDVAPTAASLRRAARRSPFVEQLFALAPDGRLIHPQPKSALSRAERAFLGRTRQIFLDRTLVRPASAEAAPLSETARGWHAYYAGSGIQLLYWQRDGSGRILGAELSRSRLLADVVSALPSTDPAGPSLSGGRIRLLDSRGTTLYQWGPYAPEPGTVPRVTLPLRPPLAAWRLAYDVSLEAAGAGLGRGVLFNVVAGIGTVALVLAGLAFYLYRESQREWRLATQRMTFVNQVSHELKTPLTNIRLYAELLQQSLDDADETTAKHIGVIVNECRRLSRLIGNVLSFAREKRGAVELHPEPGMIDQTVREVMEEFRPSLAKGGIAWSIHAGAPGRVRFDADAVGQILGNLVSNVEKYAASGKRLDVDTAQTDGVTTITVRDRGPGIPAGASERVFLSFVRLSDRLSEGVSGTGIGLSIARELARLHGGDLEALPSSDGAAFRVTLKTERVRDDA